MVPISANSFISLYKLGMQIIKTIGETGYDMFFTSLNDLCNKDALANLIFGYPWWLRTWGDKSLIYILIVLGLGTYIVTQIIKFIIKAFFASGLPLI